MKRDVPCFVCGGSLPRHARSLEVPKVVFKKKPSVVYEEVFCCSFDCTTKAEEHGKRVWSEYSTFRARFDLETKRIKEWRLLLIELNRVIRDTSQGRSTSSTETVAG